VRGTSLIDRIPLAPLSALLMGAAVAFFCFAMPVALLERLVLASGAPAIIAAAAPPLGATARMLVGGGAALAAASVTWFVFGLIGGKPRSRTEREPVMIFEDEENFPEPLAAPPRRPLFASEIEPAMEAAEPPVEEEPEFAEWTEIAETEETLELVEPIVEPESAPDAVSEASVTALLARFETGLERRAAKRASTAPMIRPAAEPLVPAETGGLDSALRDALSELQRMAAR
jgi:hypothetical protein